MSSRKHTHSDFDSFSGTRTAYGPRAARSTDKPLDKGVVAVPTKRGDFVITRRHLVIGAAGIAAMAGIGVGSSVISKRNKQSSYVDVLSVPKSSVTSMANYTEVDANTYLYTAAEFELPYGTLLWANGAMAACLVPGETGSPLNSIGLLWLSTGYCPIVLDAAIGTSDGYEILDVRGSEWGFIWTEVNVLQNAWRIYASELGDNYLVNPILLDEGDAEWETPTLAVVDNYAFWQVLPNLSGSHTTDASVLKKAVFGSAQSSVVYSSPGRMATAPTTTTDGVIITPRAQTEGAYYQLTLLRASDDSIVDTMVLPQSMKPLEAGYGVTGFNFSFDGIYNYGDGIANLGTYTPTIKPTNSSYSDVPWFTLNRDPSAPASWCGNLFMVKSTTAVCGVDFESGCYCILETHAGAEDYGAYLASSGESDCVVTYTNVNNTPIEGESTYATVVRVYR